MTIKYVFRCAKWAIGKKIIISDEAHFDLCGYVNKKNWRIWGTENPHANIKKPTQPKRVTVWFEFWSRGIIERRERPLQSMAIIIGPFEQIFVHKN